MGTTVCNEGGTFRNRRLVLRQILNFELKSKAVSRRGAEIRRERRKAEPFGLIKSSFFRVLDIPGT